VRVSGLFDGFQFLEERDASIFRAEELHVVTSHKIVIVNLYTGVKASNFPDPKRILW
jgi:hypothetical protein